MVEQSGDIWTAYEAGGLIVIPTNGVVTTRGWNVMGKGLALDAAKRFIGLPAELGDRITLCGNRVFNWQRYRLITFPTKHHWRDKSDIDLIERGAIELASMDFERVYMPRVGCGNGGLYWSTVRPIIERYLSSSVVVVDHGA